MDATSFTMQGEKDRPPTGCFWVYTGYGHLTKKINLNPKVMNTTMTIIWGVPYFWTNQFLASENFKMQRTTIIMKSTPQSYMKCMCFAEPLEPQFDNFGRGPYHRGIARCCCGDSRFQQVGLPMEHVPQHILTSQG
jgi:hypothetical protein